VGLLDNTTPQQYYQGNNHGNYQFTSLEDVISQFEVGFVGQDKIIPKVKRADIAFYARQALRELCFDTLKSCKSQEIKLPASLSMILPHDYINYVRVSWVDSAGIKHPLYYTNNTNNPFAIAQNEDGTYYFDNNSTDNIVTNNTFSPALSEWDKSPITNIRWNNYLNFMDFIIDNTGSNPYSLDPPGTTAMVSQGGSGTNGIPHIPGKLYFHHQSAIDVDFGELRSMAGWVFQQIDVSNVDSVNLYADGQAVDTAGGAPGFLRVGLSTTNPNLPPQVFGAQIASNVIHRALDPDFFDLQNVNGDPSYLEWTTGNNTTTKTLSQINVENVNSVFLTAMSFHLFEIPEYSGPSIYGVGLQTTNNVTNIAVTGFDYTNLTSSSADGTSSVTLNNYNSTTSSEINNGDYNNGTFLPMQGERYGLDPQYAQTNGSFYIDCANGKINFSSNLAGKTIILDYISDALGTDEEMQVHKFAEEAMYKYIVHAIIESSSYGQALVPSLTKEKAAAMKQAKIRLSNLKLEELTQVLRGKSKQIKH